MRKIFILALLFFLLSLNAVFGGESAYIGSQACFACHSDQERGWPKNPHHLAEKGCEACHGQGGLHQESMDKKDIINPAKADPIKICGACHLEKGKLEPQSWTEGAHAKAGFTCLDCHALHKTGNPKLLAGKKVNELCYACHSDKEEIFRKGRHGRQGLQCTACHSPHGTKYDKMLKSEGNEVCQACHEREPHHFIADKQNKKMRRLPCTGCHQPHSSAKQYLIYKKGELCVHCHKSLY